MMITIVSNAYGCDTADYKVVALPGENQSIAYFVMPRKGETKELVLRHLWDICNHDDELDGFLYYNVLFIMPKISMALTVSPKPVLESLNMPWLTKKRFTLDKIVDHSIPLLLPAELNDIQQSVRLCLDETTMKVRKACKEGILELPVMMEGAPVGPPIKSLWLTSPFFIVIKDKTSDGTTRIVYTAWISDPR